MLNLFTIGCSQSSSPLGHVAKQFGVRSRSSMRKPPVTRRQFLGSGIAAAGAISIGGALPANAREWSEYSARFDRSISDDLPTGPLRPDDESAWKAVAKNYTVTNKITNLENGYWGIMAQSFSSHLASGPPHPSHPTNLLTG